MIESDEELLNDIKYYTPDDIAINDRYLYLSAVYNKRKYAKASPTVKYIFDIFKEIFDLRVCGIFYTIPGESEPKVFRPWDTRWNGRRSHIDHEKARAAGGLTVPTDINEKKSYDPNYPCHGGDCCYNDVSPKYYIENWSEIKLIFDECPDKEVTLEKPVELINSNNGLNENHRGSNHLAIELDGAFKANLIIPANTYKFVDLAYLAWNIKGNIFDNIYEAVFLTKRGFTDIFKETSDMYIIKPCTLFY